MRLLPGLRAISEIVTFVSLLLRLAIFFLDGSSMFQENPVSLIAGPQM